LNTKFLDYLSFAVDHGNDETLLLLNGSLQCDLLLKKMTKVMIQLVCKNDDNYRVALSLKSGHAELSLALLEVHGAVALWDVQIRLKVIKM